MILIEVRDRNVIDRPLPPLRGVRMRRFERIVILVHRVLAIDEVVDVVDLAGIGRMTHEIRHPRQRVHRRAHEDDRRERAVDAKAARISPERGPQLRRSSVAARRRSTRRSSRRSPSRRTTCELTSKPSATVKRISQSFDERPISRPRRPPCANLVVGVGGLAVGRLVAHARVAPVFDRQRIVVDRPARRPCSARSAPR